MKRLASEIVVKKDVQFFISYARKNQTLANRFVEEFSEQVGSARRYRYHFWRDTALLVGQDWHEEIQNAVEECDLGILLISPSFLNSSYINEHELPAFLGDRAKPVIPVMLQRVDFNHHDLRGLGKFQIFRYQKSTFKQSKTFAECKGLHRTAFAQALFREVQERLDQINRKSLVGG